MKRLFNISILCLAAVAAVAQNDSTIQRTVTVERQFQPVIQSAGKIDVIPHIEEVEQKETEVNYSDYYTPLQLDFNTNPLGYADVNFSQPQPLNGFMRGAVGHSATRFDFTYRVSDRKDVRLDLQAHHIGDWGRKTMSRSSLGIDFSKLFRKGDLFFDVNAQNIFFTRYGKYFEYTDTTKMTGAFDGLDSYADFKDIDKSNHWIVDANIGVRSLPKQDVQYLVQTGYEAFIMGKDLTEHNINTRAMLDWKTGAHHAGADVVVQNHLYSADLSGFSWAPGRTDTTINNYHAVKVEPFYAYDGKRFFIHAGVNLDMCIGKGKLFRPSPNVTFEAKLTQDWLTLYGGAVGDYQTSSVREHFDIVRYLHPENEIATRQNRSWIPVDGFLGFKIRPQANLLIDLFGHYILTKDQVYLMPDNGYFNLTGGDNYQWKIGGKITYHYKDIINVSLDGFYAIGTMLTDSIRPNGTGDFHTYYNVPEGHILDKPTWGINFRLDARINSKISLYSANYFGGGRYALDNGQGTTGTVQAIQLKPIIDLNLGAQYNINKWLSCYLQVNNYLHRKHDIFYGYQSNGINFLAGITWSF